jgi:hypothetical protein
MNTFWATVRCGIGSALVGVDAEVESDSRVRDLTVP